MSEPVRLLRSVRAICCGLSIAVAVGVLLAACSASLEPSGRGNQTGSIAATGSTTLPGDAEVLRRRVPAKVALVLPLTGSGPTEPVAQAMRRAAEQALHDHNATGIQLLVKDDRGTPEGAAAAVEQALGEGAELILGPLLSASVTAAARPARARGVPMIAFSSDRAVAGNGVWLVSFSPDREVRRVVEHAAAKGTKRFAGLVPDDAYGRLAEASFRSAVARAGGHVLFLESYSPQGRGLLQGAQALAGKLAAASEGDAPVEALFLPVAPEQLPTLASLLPQMGLDATRTRLLGAGGWEEVDFANLPSLVGAWYAGPEPAGWRHFAADFGRVNGLQPPRIAALAHDAVGIAAALSSGEPGQRFRPADLTRASGFSGVEGVVRLAADGTAERPLAVLEVHREGARVVDPAAVAGSPRQPLSQAEAEPATPILPLRTVPLAAVAPPRTE